MTGRVRSTKELIAAIRAARDLLSDAIDLHERPGTGPSNALSTGVENGLQTRSAADDHLRRHRRGRPSKIDTDAELGAFIRAPIDTMTFKQLAAAVADRFPPHRRTGTSALHSWWQKRDHLN